MLDPRFLTLFYRAGLGLFAIWFLHATAYGTYCAGIGVNPSTGRTNVGWETAAAGSLLARLKNGIYHRSRFTIKPRARSADDKYIESSYNRKCMSPTPGYRTPASAA